MKRITHEENNDWNQIIRRLHEKTPLTVQLDLSATPRFQKGAIFPWTIFDYPLKQAIVDGIVKRPMKGVAKIHEAKSTIASVRQALSDCRRRALERISRSAQAVEEKAGAVHYVERYDGSRRYRPLAAG
jgi:hypothetical protein